MGWVGLQKMDPWTTQLCGLDLGLDLGFEALVLAFNILALA